jgi:anthranilate phosphoribosyltransferase
MKQILHHLFEHQSLARSEAKEVLIRLADGRYTESQIAAFATVYAMRSITVDEILGFREALLDIGVSLESLRDYRPIDIVGTGGDGKNTFNISTAACFVTAGAGYKVVKHGNIGATSVSGASNVMAEHGVRFTTDIAVHRRSLEACNLAYLHAPLFSPALKAVAPVRQALAVRTFFNIVGPLVHPVRPQHQVLGVYDLKMARLYQYIYQASGDCFSIVHSLDGYDEISLTDTFKLITHHGERLYQPEDLGFRRADPAELSGGQTPQTAAAIFDRVLNNEATESQRNVVVVNAAAAIRTLQPDATWEACIAQAQESLDAGRARAAFMKFLTLNT